VTEILRGGLIGAGENEGLAKGSSDEVLLGAGEGDSDGSLDGATVGILDGEREGVGDEAFVGALETGAVVSSSIIEPSSPTGASVPDLSGSSVGGSECPSKCCCICSQP
jgi:hypothetical protein